MLLYILITHGPRSCAPIQNCSAAKQQITNFRHALRDIDGASNVSACHDYSRKHSTLNDLPTLETALSRAKERGDVIVIDDFRRIFVKCDIVHRVALLDELLGYGGHFRDLRTGVDIGQLNHSKARNILQVESPYKFELAKAPRSPRTADEKREQTFRATQASQVARSAAADQKAEALDDLYRSLSSETANLSMAELARTANRQGLKTTTGRSWTGVSVARALKRLTPTS